MIAFQNEYMGRIENAKIDEKVIDVCLAFSNEL